MARTLLDFQDLLKSLSTQDVQNIAGSGRGCDKSQPQIPSIMAMDEIKRRAEMRKITEGEEAEQQVAGARPMVDEYMDVARSLSAPPQGMGAPAPQQMPSPTDMPTAPQAGGPPMGGPPQMGPPQGFNRGGGVSRLTPEEIRKLYAQLNRYEREAMAAMEGGQNLTTAPEYIRQIQDIKRTYLPDKSFWQRRGERYLGVEGGYDPGEYVESLQRTADREPGPESEHALAQLDRMASTFRGMTPYEEWAPKRRSIIEQEEARQRQESVPASYHGSGAAKAESVNAEKERTEKAIAAATDPTKPPTNKEEWESLMREIRGDIPTKMGRLGTSLMTAGATMMAGDSPHAGVNIGRGLAAGVQEYTGQREAGQRARLAEGELRGRMADAGARRRDIMTIGEFLEAAVDEIGNPLYDVTNPADMIRARKALAAINSGVAPTRVSNANIQAALGRS